jgi:hypothetical protein
VVRRLDRDYHSRSAIAKNYEDAKRARVRLHIWSRKEIENYFLVPETIARAIRRRMPARTEAPTDVEIMGRMELACEGLKEEVFDAIAADVLAEDRSLGAGGAKQAGSGGACSSLGNVDREA